jgi:hypothetical protein
MPSRRTFAAGILPFALSKKTSLRHRGYARFPTPLDWHGQPLRPTEFPEGPLFPRRRTLKKPRFFTVGNRRIQRQMTLSTGCQGGRLIESRTGALASRACAAPLAFPAQLVTGSRHFC